VLVNNSLLTSVPDPHHFDADPDADPACYFDADPDADPAHHFDKDPDANPTFHFGADPDPTFHFDADPDPTFQIKAHHLKMCYIGHTHIPYHFGLSSAN
jgi:hypothetical protein